MESLEPHREMTSKERKAIKRLVVNVCANYDIEENSCIPLDGSCYMLCKRYTGIYCNYFCKSVLPLNSALEATMMGYDNSLSQKECAVCGSSYIPITSQAFCSELCRAKKRTEMNREYKKKSRSKDG